MDSFNLGSSKAYESMVARRSYNYSDIEAMLDIVKQFIIDNKRILYGGMALDLAARLRGEFVYDDKDEVLPDYDFYSPDPIGDAYRLTELFYKKGYKTVNAISALHVTTMRVRFDNDTVADISYMPPSIFNNLPTLKNEKLTIVHPLYQKMDQHKSFTEPFRDPPREPIFHRFKKDMTRFQLIDRLYPIEDDIKLYKSSKDPVFVETIIPKFSDIVYVGYVSYLVHYLQLKELMKNSEIEVSVEQQNIFKEIIVPNYRVDKKDLFISLPSFKLNDVDPIAFWSDKIYDMVKLVNKVEKSKPIIRNPYMDNIRPCAVRMGKCDIFDNYGGLRPAAEYKINNITLNVSTGQATLLYFLHRSFEPDDGLSTKSKESIQKDKRCFYLKMYQSTKKIIELTEDLLLTNFETDSLKKYIENMSVFISTDTYGCCNVSEVYEIAKKYNDYAVNNVPAAEREKLRPQSYYPERKAEPPAIIDITKLEYFHIDGSITNSKIR